MEKAFPTDGQLKKAIMNKGNLKARAANAILKEARTIYTLAREVKQVQIENHNQKIKELKSEIRELEEQKNELHLSDYNWSRPPKNAVKKLHKIKSMLWSKKDKLHRFIQSVQRLEKEVKTGIFSYCFGSKQLSSHQWTLEHPSSPFSTHEQWLKAWRDHRFRHVYFLGSHDESCGCQLVQGTYTGDQDLFEFKVRSPYAKDKLVISFRVRIPYQTEQVDYYQMYGSISYVFVFKENGSLYLHPQIKEEPKEIKSAKGCLGMDINAGFLAVALANENGNYVFSEDIYYDQYSADADTALHQTLAAVYKIAESEGWSVAIEDISLRKKKSRNHGKKLNHILHDFPYRKYRSYNEKKASRSGVPLHIVSAFYTSRIGKEKYQNKLQTSTHQAAAFVIARRALGFTEWYEPEKSKSKRMNANIGIRS